jgi:hypothetical protein
VRAPISLTLLSRIQSVPLSHSPGIRTSPQSLFSTIDVQGYPAWAGQHLRICGSSWTAEGSKALENISQSSSHSSLCLIITNPPLAQEKAWQVLKDAPHTGLLHPPPGYVHIRCGGCHRIHRMTALCQQLSKVRQYDRLQSLNLA